MSLLILCMKFDNFGLINRTIKQLTWLQNTPQQNILSNTNLTEFQHAPKARHESECKHVKTDP